MSKPLAVAVNCGYVKIRAHPNYYYVGRPTVWGNPYSVKRYGREDAIRLYREWIMTQPLLLEMLPKLRGKMLGCYCAPLACHADVLAELVNALPDTKTR